MFILVGTELRFITLRLWKIWVRLKTALREQAGRKCGCRQYCQLKITVVCDVTLYGVIKLYQRLRVMCCFYHQGRRRILVKITRLHGVTSQKTVIFIVTVMTHVLSIAKIINSVWSGLKHLWGCVFIEYCHRSLRHHYKLIRFYKYYVSRHFPSSCLYLKTPPCLFFNFPVRR
jgi:hypothetical protein